MPVGYRALLGTGVKARVVAAVPGGIDPAGQEHPEHPATMRSTTHPTTHSGALAASSSWSWCNFGAHLCFRNLLCSGVIA